MVCGIAATRTFDGLLLAQGHQAGSYLGADIHRLGAGGAGFTDGSEFVAAGGACLSAGADCCAVCGEGQDPECR